MAITLEQFQSDLSKYLNLAKKENIMIQLSDSVVLELHNPSAPAQRLAKMQSLFGSVPDHVSRQQAKEERLAKV